MPAALAFSTGVLKRSARGEIDDEQGSDVIHLLLLSWRSPRDGGVFKVSIDELEEALSEAELNFGSARTRLCALQMSQY